MNAYKKLRNIATAALLCIISLSCTATMTKNAVQSSEEQKLEYGKLVVPSHAPSDYLLIPVGLPIESNKSRGFISSKGGYSEKDIYGVIPYNLVFYNKTSGEAHLLLKRNALIDNFTFLTEKPEVQPGRSQPKNKGKAIALLVKLIENDTNGDGEINRQDAIVAYLADTDGKNIKPIMPPKTTLISWHLDAKLGFLLLKIRKDANNDGTFTKEDETTFIRVNLENPEIGTEIIPEAVRQQIEQGI
ncbi:MAG: hypothetical protein F6J93_15395 [Oscillatoria sp. SIO1A7]|nr:hypothetical protein [Oscillatoria sp. SIO1A7]